MRSLFFATIASLACTACSSSNDTTNGSDAGSDASTSRRFDAGTLDPTYFDSCATSLVGDPIFTLASPDPSVVDTAALDKILSDAVTAKSNSVVVAVGDTIIADKCFVDVSTPGSVQSITKSIVSLEIGALISDGKIPSIDTLVSVYYPEWASADARAQVTLRHLLTQTSGIVDTVDADSGVPAFLEAKDELAYARAQVPRDVPGSTFNYSSVGVMLFAGIIEQAAGVDAQTFAEQRFFSPLGIADDRWDRDSVGNVMTAGGLYLTPIDLLRVARLARENGSWQGQSLVPASWLTLTTAPETITQNPCYGYLWWMVRNGCASDTGLVGTAGALQGFYADGYGGNVAVVVPSTRVLGVRTITPPSTATSATNFDSFVNDLGTLVK